ncbi:MAG: thioredoxin family protein [Planctomycetota bacterium]|nr:MAG: thioredoxin family protein [Planctomycetota bacterium]
MILNVLGTGCAKCNKLAAVTEEAAKQMGIDYEIKKITDITEIMAFDVMMTPALAIGDEVKVSGRVPSIDELKTLLS